MVSFEFPKFSFVGCGVSNIWIAVVSARRSIPSGLSNADSKFVTQIRVLMIAHLF